MFLCMSRFKWTFLYMFFGDLKLKRYYAIKIIDESCCK